MSSKKSRFLIILMLTSVCVSLYGCWNESVGDASHSKLIGYISDSLAVYATEDIEETCVHKPLGEECSDKDKGFFLSVENFYTNNVLWESLHTDEMDVFDVYDLVNDSTVVIFRKSDGSFFKWILGEKFEKLGVFSWSGCNTQERINSIRNWGDGKWRLVGKSVNCAYAIADVEKKKIIGYEKIDDFAEDCSDLWDHEGIKYCVGAVKRDTVMSYYERYLAGAMIRNDKGFGDTLWNNQIEGVSLNSYHAVEFKNLFVCYLDRYYKVDYESVKMVFDH